MAPRAVACVVVVAIAGTACGGTTKRATTPTPEPPGPRLTPQPRARPRRGAAQRLRRAASSASPAAIVFPDGREWGDADGLAVVPSAQPMTPRTSMPFDSVTKMATAALALRSPRRAGCVSTTRSSAGTRPGTATRARRVRDLLGHVSGPRDSRDGLLCAARPPPAGEVTASARYIAATPRPGPRTHETRTTRTRASCIAGLILAAGGQSSRWPPGCGASCSPRSAAARAWPYSRPSARTAARALLLVSERPRARSGRPSPTAARCCPPAPGPTRPGDRRRPRR